MAFVLDASATLPWFFRDEATSTTESLLTQARRDVPMIVPQHWPYEVLNTLLQAARKGRISQNEISDALRDLAQLRVEVAIITIDELFSLRDLAARHKLTAHDAAYLELALRRRLPLATLDKDLASAARAEAVPLLL